MNPKSSAAAGPQEYVEEVQVRGHIIDSLILPKILDLITAAGGAFRIKRDLRSARRGTTRATRWSKCEAASTSNCCRKSCGQITDHGAVPRARRIANWWRPTWTAPFPKAFTAPPTSGPKSALAGHWLEVADQEMDCGIVVDPAAGHGPLRGDDAKCSWARDSSSAMPACACFPSSGRRSGRLFEFMDSSVSTEKPKGVAIRQIAQRAASHRAAAAGRCWSAGRPSCIPAASSTSAELIRQG